MGVDCLYREFSGRSIHRLKWRPATQGGKRLHSFFKNVSPHFQCRGLADFICLLARGRPGNEGRAERHSGPGHRSGRDGPLRAAGKRFFRLRQRHLVEEHAHPQDMGRYGIGGLAYELTSQRTADLIKQAAAKKAPPATEARKIGNFFTAFMDTATIDARGLKPLRPVLDRIAAITDPRGLSEFLGSRLRADVDILNATDLLYGQYFRPVGRRGLEQPEALSSLPVPGRARHARPRLLPQSIAAHDRHPG